MDQIYNYAANLMLVEKKLPYETKKALMDRGLDPKSASDVVENLELQIREAEKNRAKKDMIYGGLWAVGGLVLTLANFGYVFWGAIAYGVFRFIKGAASA